MGLAYVIDLSAPTTNSRWVMFRFSPIMCTVLYLAKFLSLRFSACFVSTATGGTFGHQVAGSTRSPFNATCQAVWWVRSHAWKPSRFVTVCHRAMVVYCLHCAPSPFATSPPMIGNGLLNI